MDIDMFLLSVEAPEREYVDPVRVAVLLSALVFVAAFWAAVAVVVFG